MHILGCPVRSVQGMGSQFVEAVNEGVHEKSGWFMQGQNVYAVPSMHTVFIVCKYENLLLCVEASQST